MSAKNQQQFLPKDFVPSDLEVVVGRGKKCTDHSGNQRMRGIVRSRIEEYANANDKTHKTYIISQIFQEIRKRSPAGGFVKKDKDTGLWFRVQDTSARMNLAQAFRDELHGTYKSSKFAKQRRRWGDAVSSTPGTTNVTTKSTEVSPVKLTVSPQADSMTTMFYPQARAPVMANQGVKKLSAATSGDSMKSMLYPSSRMGQMNCSFTSNNEDPSLYLFGGASRSAPANPKTSSRTSAEKNTAISDILSAALGAIDDDDDFLADLPTEMQSTTGLPDAPAPMMANNSFSDHFTFDALLSLTDTVPAQNNELTENPFEPTPIAMAAPSMSMMEHPFLDCMF